MAKRKQIVEKEKDTLSTSDMTSVKSFYQNRMVNIQPIDRKNWAGFTRYPKCKDTITTHQGRGGFHTGLNKEQQTQLEIDLGYDPNHLAAYSEFWMEYCIHIHDKPLQLDLSKPKDFLDYQVCLQSRRVANSITELEQWPKAEYVIYDKEEDAKKENTSVKERRKAFGKFGNMSTSEMKDVLKLMGKRANNMTATMIENEVDRVIQDSPEEFNKIVGLSNFATRVLIEDLLGVNAVRKSGTHYLVGDDVIGHDLESTILHLEDPKNQNLLISLKNKLEALV